MRKRREQATNSSLPENIRVHYDADRERTRLEHSAGALERLRTQELITRYVPPLPAVVVDAGGGTGPYAIWLAEQGYTVYLLDVMPLHIERACQDATMHAASLASLTVGDAGQLAFPAGSVDVVLLLGPLYHLTEHQDRLAAW